MFDEIGILIELLESFRFEPNTRTPCVRFIPVPMGETFELLYGTEQGNLNELV